MAAGNRQRRSSLIKNLKDRTYLVTVFLKSCAAGLMMAQTQYIYTRVTESYMADLLILMMNGTHSPTCGSSFSNTSSQAFYKELEIQAEISNDAAQWTMYMTLANLIPLIFTILLLGSRSDQVGRRFIFLLNLVASAVRGVILSLVVYFKLPLYALVIGEAIEGMAGGTFGTVIASYSHSSDQHNEDESAEDTTLRQEESHDNPEKINADNFPASHSHAISYGTNTPSFHENVNTTAPDYKRPGADDTEGKNRKKHSRNGVVKSNETHVPDDNRSVRLLAIECFSLMAYGFLQLANGYIIKYGSFFYPAIAATGVLIVDIVFTFFFFADSEKQVRSERTGRSVFEPLRIVFRAVRQPHKLLAFILCNLAFMVIVFGDGGLARTVTIYQMSPPYCWGSLEIGWFTSELYFSTILAVPLLMLLKRLKFSDPAMAGIGALIEALGSAIFSAAGNNGWIFYLATVVLTPGMLAIALTRTITSRLAGPEALGSLFAVTTLVEQIMILVGTVTGTSVYQSTVTKFHSAVFVYFSLIFFIASLIYFIEAYIDRRRNLRRQKVLTAGVKSDPTHTPTEENN